MSATKLFACPLCGADKGYMLQGGSTYRWWEVCCKACGEAVTECRSDRNTSLDAPKPDRDIAADEAWNAAGQYAEGLRKTLAECSEADTKRLYWIFERINNPKAVLTASCMEGLDNPTSLRSAIDAAMRVGPTREAP